MNMFKWVAIAAILFHPISAGAELFGTGFTYQGQLARQGEPAEGEFDFRFTLYDAAESGTVAAGPVELENVVVRAGNFAAGLDFGDALFSEDAYWLEIAVRPGASLDVFTVLLPRQQIHPAPRALYARRAGTAGQSTTADSAATLQGFAPGDFALASHTHPALYWSLSGNAGTGGAGFLGTTDLQPFSLGVNSEVGLRLLPGGSSPSLVGGYGGNAVGPATEGAAIAGGGRDLAINEADGHYSAVGGGAGNSAAGYSSMIGGGEGNTASGSYSGVAGGSINLASGDYAAVSGGRQNEVTQNYSLIAGGLANTVNQPFGSILGGANNSVSGLYAAIGGGSYNHADAAYATIAGGGPSDTGNPTTSHNRVYDDYGTVGGGGGNIAGNGTGDTTDAAFATVGGGRGNGVAAAFGTIAGGLENTAGAYAAAVGGGWSNTAIGNYSAIAGGTANVAAAQNAAVAGGSGNEAAGRAAALGGGENNTAGAFGSVGGGGANTASGNYATIPGGAQNVAFGNYSLAAGFHAEAMHAGSFVWADSGTDAFGTTADNQFLVQASGGVGIGTDAPAERLTIRGNLLVAGQEDPEFLGSVSPDDPGSGNHMQSPRGVQAVGSSVFVVSYSFNLLHVIDASQPANMVETAFTLENLSGPLGLHVVADRAYIASRLNDRLVVMDVSDRHAPVSLGSADSVDQPRDVFVAGRFAYLVSSGNISEPVTPAALQVFDVSDPAAILPRGGIGDGLVLPVDVKVQGPFAFVADAGAGALLVFDVSDPDNIVARGSATVEAASPQAVHVVGNTAFVAMQDIDSLVAYDISDVDNITLLGSIADNLSAPRDVLVSGSYAYVASFGNDRIAVFDVSDPSQIVPLGFTSSGLAGPTALALAGERLYVSSQGNDSLVAFDINHLDSPAARIGSLQASQLDITDYARIARLDVSGGLNVGLAGAMIGGDLAVRGSVAPATDDEFTLGEADKRWSAVHAMNGVIQTSDGRLKENVTPLAYGLDDILRLEPVSFTWKGRDDGDRHLGLIAQDVLKVFPELVQGDEDDAGTLGLNYAELVPVLVSGLKQLRREVEGQRRLIEELRARLDERGENAAQEAP